MSLKNKLKNFGAKIETKVHGGVNQYNQVVDGLHSVPVSVDVNNKVLYVIVGVVFAILVTIGLVSRKKKG